MRTPARVLIIRLSAVGDVIDTLPALQALRSAFPKTHLAWVVEPRAADILRGHPDLDEVLVFPRTKFHTDGGREIPHLERFARSIAHKGKTVPAMLAFFSELRRRRFDWAIDFHGNAKSGLVAAVSGARIRIGMDRSQVREGNSLFTHRRIPLRTHGTPMHRIERNLLLIRRLGLPAAYTPAKISVTEEDRRHIDRFVRENRIGPPWVVIHAGASYKGSYKRWPTDRYAELADRLQQEGIRVILSWGSGERELAESIISRMRQPAHMAPPTNLKQLAALIEKADGFISGDSGPMHIAGALRRPTVALFGPKDPAVYGPYQTPGEVIYKKLHCSPCRNIFCPHIQCMQDITVDEVFAAAQRMLAGSPTRG
jgi:lipopolysaccharide heptosyltransferase I